LEWKLTSVHLLTSLRSVCPIRIADERKALGPPRLAILSQEHPSDMSIPAEHVPQILLLGKLADVGYTQRSTIIAIELAAHLLSRPLLATQMRRHISTASRTQSTRTSGRIVRHISGRDIALWRHGVLERTLCGEVIALADTALDLRVLELRLLLRLVALVFVACLPRGYGPEQDVLSYADGVCLGARGLALFCAEFCPLLALGHAGVYGGFDDGLFDAAGGLVAAAVFADAVGCDGFGSVFIFGDGLGGEGELVVVVFFGPVGAPAFVSMW